MQLQSRPRTPQEMQEHLAQLKEWIAQEKNTPAEEMGAFFAQRLSIYDQVHLKNWGEEYAHIADFFDSPCTHLLDIGCGTGLELEAIFRRFPTLSVTGIDLSPEMLQRLREKYPNRSVHTIVADYTQYPFEREQYDAALSFETLHHFPYQEKGAIYQKLFEAIRPGGFYLECDYVACCEEEEALCLELYAAKRQKSDLPAHLPIHVDLPLTMEHQIELMRRAGFQEVQLRYQKESTAIFQARKATPLSKE